MLLRPSNFFTYFSIFEKEYICNICLQKVYNRLSHIRFCHNEIYANFKNLKYQKEGLKWNIENVQNAMMYMIRGRCIIIFLGRNTSVTTVIWTISVIKMISILGNIILFLLFTMILIIVSFISFDIVKEGIKNKDIFWQLFGISLFAIYFLFLLYIYLTVML